jgi:hypothetical protein
MKKLTTFLIALVSTFTAIAQKQPFEQYGYKVKIATLSKGKYIEHFDQDTIVQIGTVLMNRRSGKIVSFVKYDTTLGEYSLKPELVSRWMSPDPLAHEFYSESPYNFGHNNPVRYVDPDGRAPLDNIYLNENGKVIKREVNDQPDRTFVIKTTKTTEDIYPEGTDPQQKGNSNAITFSEANKTEREIKKGNLSGDHMNNLVEIADTKTRAEFDKVSKQDDGSGGNYIKKPANNVEYGAKRDASGNVVSGKGTLTAAGGFIRGQWEMHTHPSGSFTLPNGNVVSSMQGPSKTDISTAKGIEYVISRGNGGMVYIYNNSGVVATLPQDRFVTPKEKK